MVWIVRKTKFAGFIIHSNTSCETVSFAQKASDDQPYVAVALTADKVVVENVKIVVDFAKVE